MKTKIYYGRDLIGRFSCDGRLYTKFQLIRMKAIRIFHRVLIVLAVFATLGWTSYITARFVSPVTVYAEKTVTIEVPVREIPPILKRIMKCESGGTHKDKNGQVVINATEDIGIMQINVPIWGKKAHEMKLDLSIEKDNIEFGMWLFDNYGSEPWYASKKCWR